MGWLENAAAHADRDDAGDDQHNAEPTRARYRLPEKPGRCVRDRWSKPSGSRLLSFFGPTLGNPSADAARQLQQLRDLLAQRGMQDLPTSSLVVFTNPKVQLRIEGCSSTVTRIKELKDVLRRMAGKGQNVALSSARIREIQTVFDERMRAAHSWR